MCFFLDKTKGVDKESWKWSCCHERCGSCHLHGTDEQNNCDTCKRDVFYFHYNQTEENGLIPGNCHDSCVDDGCYKKEEGIHIKMCECLPHCKVCQDGETCDECREEWLLQPEKTSCNQSCNYCLTPYWEKEETKEKGRCVNCKTDFTPAQYTYKNKCYKESEIPEFTYKEYRSQNDFYDVTKNIMFTTKNVTCSQLVKKVVILVSKKKQINVKNVNRIITWMIHSM